MSKTLDLYNHLKDKLGKNIEVYADEFNVWWYNMTKHHLPRFGTGSFRLDKTSYLHLYRNLWTETVRDMPRILSEIAFWVFHITLVTVIVRGVL